MKYNEMTDVELDLLTLEIMGWYVDAAGTIYVKETKKFSGYRLGGVHPLGHPSRWNPTRRDSNQVESFLYKKIKDLGCRIDTHDSNTFTFQIIIHANPKDISQHPICEMSSEENDVDNRTKTIACLRTWEKLK